MSNPTPSTPLPTLLSRLLPPTHTTLRTSLIPTLLTSLTSIAKALREAHHVSLLGTSNSFGDEQLNVDVAAEKILRDALGTCREVAAISSEEDPIERPTGAGREGGEEQGQVQGQGEKYAIAFDPLDGSSIVAPNWTVGTIVGIWEGDSALRVSPEKQIAAILGVYGPRTGAFVAIRLPGQEGVCFEVGLSDDGNVEVLREAVRFDDPGSSKTRYFAPANLRAAGEDARYMGLINHFIHDRWTLRYAGGLVPDIAHALVKGHGVYVSPTTERSRAKLRRLYELAPIALVVECAGGKAVDPVDGRRVLERAVGDEDERGGLICGTGEDVDMVVRMLLG